MHHFARVLICNDTYLAVSPHINTGILNLLALTLSPLSNGAHCYQMTSLLARCASATVLLVAGGFAGFVEAVHRRQHRRHHNYAENHCENAGVLNSGESENFKFVYDRGVE